MYKGLPVLENPSLNKTNTVDLLIVQWKSNMLELFSPFIKLNCSYIISPCPFPHVEEAICNFKVQIPSTGHSEVWKQSVTCVLINQNS